MILVVMPSLRAQASTSRPPTSLNSCTLGTFFDQTSEYSSVTWYSIGVVEVGRDPDLAGDRVDLGARDVVQQRVVAVALVQRQRVVDRLVGRPRLAAGLRSPG